MTTLRVTLDEAVASPYGGASRYASELTRAVVATAPAGAEVIGMVPASPEPDYERVLERVPGLAHLDKSVLAARELAAAWRRGLARTTGSGMVHATSFLAPLGPHDRVHNRGDQVAVTVSDAIAWTHPELLPARTVSWREAMLKRAERYADAVVVPSHAVAAELKERHGFGDRIRVIPGAPSSRLVPTPDVDDEALELPAAYVLTVASAEPKKNLPMLLEAMRHTHDERALVIAGDDVARVRELVDAAGLPEGRVRVVGPLSDAQLGRAYLGADAFVQPSLAEGLGLAVIEALAFGLPIVHSAIPTLDELTAGAAISLDLTGADAAGRLAEALDSVEGAVADRLSTAAGDRARAFDWRDSAERVWQLHADL